VQCKRACKSPTATCSVGMTKRVWIARRRLVSASAAGSRRGSATVLLLLLLLLLQAEVAAEAGGAWAQCNGRSHTLSSVISSGSRLSAWTNGRSRLGGFKRWK
jgi:hypothetical protein